MKQLLITVHPEHAVNIINGNATLLIHKYIPKDFKGWVNVCVAKRKPYLIRQSNFGWQHQNQFSYNISNKLNFYEDCLNGKVVCCFWLDEYTLFNNNFNGNEWVYDDYILEKSCLEDYELDKYLNQDGPFRQGYAWHIKQLEIFDKPKALGEFRNIGKFKLKDKQLKNVWKAVTKAPSKYMFVWSDER